MHCGNREDLGRAEGRMNLDELKCRRLARAIAPKESPRFRTGLNNGQKLTRGHELS